MRAWFTREIKAILALSDPRNGPNLAVSGESQVAPGEDGRGVSDFLAALSAVRFVLLVHQLFPELFPNLIPLIRGSAGLRIAKTIATVLGQRPEDVRRLPIVGVGLDLEVNHHLEGRLQSMEDPA